MTVLLRLDAVFEIPSYEWWRSSHDWLCFCTLNLSHGGLTTLRHNFAGFCCAHWHWLAIIGIQLHSAELNGSLNLITFKINEIWHAHDRVQTNYIFWVHRFISNDLAHNETVFNRLITSKCIFISNVDKSGLNNFIKLLTTECFRTRALEISHWSWHIYTLLKYNDECQWTQQSMIGCRATTTKHVAFIPMLQMNHHLMVLLLYMTATVWVLAYDNHDTMKVKADPPIFIAFCCSSQLGGFFLTKNANV